MEPFNCERWNKIAAFDAPQFALYVERGRAMDKKFNKLAEGMRGGGYPQACRFRLSAQRSARTVNRKF